MVLQQPTPFVESNIFSEIREIEVQKNNLMNLRDKGIIDGVDVVIQELSLQTERCKLYR